VEIFITTHNIFSCQQQTLSSLIDVSGICLLGEIKEVTSEAKGVSLIPVIR
jgi:selenophosphate synthase